MNKDYLYKVHRTDRVTDKNYVLDGDFEGVYNTDFLTQWASVGTPTRMARSRDDTYLGTLGKKITFDGTDDYWYPPQFEDTSYGMQNTDFTIAFWFTKSSYSGMNQCFFDGKNTIAGNAGLRLEADGTNLIAEVSLSGTYRSTTYALASIANGRHLFGMGSDGRYVRLFIDGVNVATYDNGSDVGVYLTSYSPGFWFGRTVANTKKLTGDLEQYCYWDKLLTAAEMLEMYQTANPVATDNLKYCFEFDTVTDGVSWDTTPSSINSWVLVMYGNPVVSTGNIYTTRSVKCITNTGGSAEQGFEQTVDYRSQIEGGLDYNLNAWVKAPVGETIKLVLTPYGGGTEQSTTAVATGSYQQVSLDIAASSLATLLKVKIVLTNASASAKTFYVDRVALNNGTEPLDFFTRDYPSAGTDVYGYDGVAHTHTYNTVEYLATWKDVISDFKYDYEINSAGSQLNVVLARGAEQTGEGTDLEFDLQVQIFQIDDDHPTGELVFVGKVANYVVDENTDKVEVQIIGYGSELNNYLVTSGENRVGIQPIYNSDISVGFWGNAAHQVFTVDRQIKLRKLVVRSNGSGNIPVRIYKGTPGGTLTVLAGTAFETQVAGNILVAESALSDNNTSLDRSDILFDDVTLYPNTQYFVDFFWTDGASIDLQSSGSSDIGAVASPFGRVYLGTATINNASFPIGLSSTNPQLYMEIWENTGSTTVQYNSQDPSDILRSILDNYQTQGGRLVYDASIQDTGTTVSYTFKSSTSFDALKKCLELASAGWFFYIDQAENKVYFKPKSTTPDHTFIIGKHFSKLTYEKRTDPIVNVIYFTGGDIGGYNLFKVYEDEASIELYGRKLLNYSDNRVTLEATADLIANTILTNKSDPEIRVPLEVLQNYPIDTINPGDVVTFRNNKGEIGEMSLWDVGNWDEAYWDYNVFNPATYELQIARFGRDGDSVNATLSTTPPDVNKRVEDINRNLEKQQTANNPDQPS